MKKFLLRIKSFAPSKRKLIQLYCALLFNANIKGFISGKIYTGSVKNICVPGLNCYSCPGAAGACPLGSLQGSFSADRSTLFYVGGILLLYGLLLGRMICGWLCPFGFIQEFLFKIKTPKLKKSRITRILSYFKYVVLIFFVFIVPIAYAFRDTPLPAFCKYICPAGTLEGGLTLLSNELNEGYFSMLGPLFTWKFALMVSFLVGCVFVFRLFCRFICPLGALYGLFNRISLFGVKVEAPKCTGCSLCVSRCKMDIKHVGDAECISCGECVDVCPTKAIVWKGPRVLLRKNDIPENTEPSKRRNTRLITRAVSCIVLLAILIGSMVFYWNEGEDIPQESEQSGNISPDESNTLEYGNAIGDLCYSGELETVTANGIGSEKIDPTKTGKITVINFWGTWCTPCVGELPYFDRIASEYRDTVTVVAVHTNMVSDTAPEYIGEYYPESNIIFARDLENEGYYTKLGGRGTYPYTVILNSDGTIAEIFLSSLKYEDLKEAVEGSS